MRTHFWNSFPVLSNYLLKSPHTFLKGISHSPRQNSMDIHPNLIKNGQNPRQLTDLDNSLSNMAPTTTTEEQGRWKNDIISVQTGIVPHSNNRWRHLHLTDLAPVAPQ